MKVLSNHPPVFRDFAKTLLCSSIQSYKVYPGSELNGKKGLFCSAWDIPQARLLAGVQNQEVHNGQTTGKGPGVNQMSAGLWPPPLLFPIHIHGSSSFRIKFSTYSFSKALLTASLRPSRSRK